MSTVFLHYIIQFFYIFINTNWTFFPNFASIKHDCNCQLHARQYGRLTTKFIHSYYIPLATGIASQISFGIYILNRNLGLWTGGFFFLRPLNKPLVCFKIQSAQISTRRRMPYRRQNWITYYLIMKVKVLPAQRKITSMTRLAEADNKNFHFHLVFTTWGPIYPSLRKKLFSFSSSGITYALYCQDNKYTLCTYIKYFSWRTFRHWTWLSWLVSNRNQRVRVKVRILRQGAVRRIAGKITYYIIKKVKVLFA
jgi:hypothetical protein